MNNERVSLSRLRDDPRLVKEVIRNGDLETLREYLQECPDSCSYRDGEDGLDLLQRSILYLKREIFDYLLSTDKFDVNYVDHLGSTAFSLSLCHDDTAYFSGKLIDKGINLRQVYYDGNTVLHLSLLFGRFTVTKLLIENGADVNARDDYGDTPLHLAIYFKRQPRVLIDLMIDLIEEGTDINGQNEEGCTPLHVASQKKNVEGVCLMMYYGADPCIMENHGYIPLDFALKFDMDVATTERLLFYTFDQRSEYEMSAGILLRMLETNCSLFFVIMEYVSQVVFIHGEHYDGLILFRTAPRFLRFLIKKFDYVVKELFCDIGSWTRFEPDNFIENCEILLNSHLESDTVQLISKFSPEFIITKVNETRADVIANFIFYLLSYGMEVYAKDVDFVFEKYHYCDLFKFLLFMDIKQTLYLWRIMPAVIYKVETDLATMLNCCDYTDDGVEELTEYYAHPKVRELCIHKGLSVQNSQVPLLLELARDASRRFLVERYNLKTSSQFYTVLNWLPISTTYKKILTFERKLYRK